MSTVRIRPETVGDYAALAAIHVRAFASRAGEALVVTLHRHRAAFDPGLSLVAELDGRVVGHALFSPQTVRLLGQDVRAVNLAPLAVDPPAQRQGVGGRLLAAGHDLAREQDYAFSFLLGHTSYYPRFGYRTRAFGDADISVVVAGLPAEELLQRGPVEADLPALHALWLHEEGAVDMAVVPGPDLLDWLSPNPHVAARVWSQGDTIVGYTRVHSAEPARPRVFLARDAAAARAIAGSLAREAGGAELRLPLHPASTSAAAFGQAESRAWDAAMVCPLLPSPFDEYEALVRAGERPAGRLIWPVAFDLA